MTAQVGATTSSDALRKSQLRKTLRKRRASLSAAQRSRAAQRAADHLIAQLSHRKARSVAAYLAYGSELSTAPLLAQLHACGVRVLLPRLRGRQMRFVAWTAHERLRRNRHGIAEPVGRRIVSPAHIDVMVMPLTGFDAQGQRLGTGGGYYDRALQHLHTRRRPWRVGYAYALQECEGLPHEAWDIRLHAICTERGLRHFRSSHRVT